MDYFTLTYWQEGSHPCEQDRGSHPSKKAAGRTEPLHGAKWAPWGTSGFQSSPNSGWFLSAMLCSAAPSLSCARRGTVRSAASISHWAFLESWVPFCSTHQELQEYLSPSPELCGLHRWGLSTWLKWWGTFSLFYWVFWVQWAQGWGWFEQNPWVPQISFLPLCNFFSCSSGSPLLWIFHILQN